MEVMIDEKVIDGNAFYKADHPVEFEALVKALKKTIEDGSFDSGSFYDEYVENIPDYEGGFDSCLNGFAHLIIGAGELEDVDNEHNCESYEGELLIGHTDDGKKVYIKFHMTDGAFNDGYWDDYFNSYGDYLVVSIEDDKNLNPTVVKALNEIAALMKKYNITFVNDTTKINYTDKSVSEDYKVDQKCTLIKKI